MPRVADPPAVRKGWRTAVLTRRPALLGAAVFVLVATRLAWMSDDAAITARVIANTLHGYGPNFNITERAQAYTHPLWFVLNTVAARVTGDILITMLVVGILCSGAAMYLVLRGRHWAVAVVVTALAASTYALTEYAGSGLENPLAWLLMAAMWSAAVRRRPTAVAVAAGLLIVTRLDLAVVAVPFVVVWAIRGTLPRPTLLLMGGLLVAPAFVWLSFSWLYYGSPLPETAYSKLNTAIPQRELFGQGVRYLLDLTQHDAIAAVLLLLALGLAVTSRLSRESGLLVGSAVGLYGLYVIAIGGDFMTGRFWTVPLFAAIVAVGDAAEALVRQDQNAVRSSAGVGVAVTAAVFGPVLLAPPVGLPMFRDTFAPAPRAATGLFDNDGIVDEWTFYVEPGHTHGLVQWITQDPFVNGLTEMRATVAQWAPGQVASAIDVRCGEVGRDALLSGPTVHWVVPCGLSDPFLSRVEFEAGEQHWRVGHYDRPIPDGYFEALTTGAAEPLPAELQDLFRRVSLPRRIPGRWAGEVTHP